MALTCCPLVPRTHLIVQTARDKGYAKVMMADSLTRVAIKLLTNLSLGRGAYLAVDTVSWGQPPTPQG